MRTFVSILFFIGLTSFSSVKKRILSYPVVISGSDLIVEGEISAVPFSVYKYDFKISEFLKGGSEQEITINMWKEWTCDSRIKRPLIGQRLILFLTKNNNGEYEIINGSTGELFINEEQGLDTFLKTDLPSLDQLKKGIKMFSKAYKYNGKLYSSYRENPYYEKLIDQIEIDEMMDQNNFFKSMSLLIESKIKKD